MAIPVFANEKGVWYNEKKTGGAAMTNLYLANIDQLADPALFARLYQTVPRHRQEKIDAKKFPRVKQQCLGAWLLLMHGLKEAGIDPKDIRLSYGPSGKPFLTDYPELFFNLSHSGDRVFCAISHKEVGCDVERIGSANFSVANRFFSKEECRIIADAPAEEQNAMFFRIWTLKESFIKNIGRGLSMPLQDFSISFSDNNVCIDQQVLSEELFFRECCFGDGYHYACCSRHPLISNVEIVSLG